MQTGPILMRHTLFFIASLALGCGSSNATTNSENSGDSGVDSMGSDAISPDADGSFDASPIYASCGSPPFVLYHLKAGEIIKGGDQALLAGATLTFDICPGVSVKTDAVGEAFASVQRGIAFTATVSAPDHVSVIAGEELVPVDDPITEDRFVQLLPRNDAGVIPGYSADAPSFALVIQPDTTPGSKCTKTDNVQFQTPSGVSAHYMLPDWPSDLAENTLNASLGAVVFFTGLSTSTTRVFRSSPAAGDDSGCTVVGDGAPLHQTGNFKLVPGAWTIGDVARVPK